MRDKLNLLGAAARLSITAVVLAPAVAHADPTPACNVGLGDASSECGANSEATGAGGTATGQFSTSSGFQSTATGSGSIASGDGGTATGAFSTASGAHSTATGEASKATGASSTATGESSRATGNFSTALGQASEARAGNSVALGFASVADRATTVSVGSVGSERQIVNVAAGTQPTDAVNLGQMQAADTALQTQMVDVQSVNTVQSTQISALDRQLAAIGTNNAAMQSDMGTLFDLRRQDRRDMRQGIAGALAMGNAPMPSQPGRVSYAVNGARFRGENAVGGSMMYRLPTRSAMAIGAGFSYAGNRNNGVRVGLAGEF